VPDNQWQPPYRFRAELPGYEPAEGQLATIPASGRITGAVFTLGIVAIFRPMTKFRETYTINLVRDPSAELAAAPTQLEERLRDLKRKFDRGELSSEDYRKQKQELLEGL